MPETPNTTTPSMTAILALLSAHHGATAAELAERASIGRSTASKTLATLEARSLARRISDERTSGVRSPDVWFAAAPVEAALQPKPTTPAPSALSNTPRSEDQAEPNPTAALDGSVLNARTGSESADAIRPDSESMPEAGSDDDVVSIGLDPAIAGLSEEKTQPDNEQLAVSSTAQLADAPAATLHDIASPPPATASPASSSDATPATQRLPKGGLRALVVEHLAAHPDQEFTAPGLSKILKRSSGAISNVFDALIKNGEAEMTRETPRTFRHRAQA